MEVELVKKFLLPGPRWFNALTNFSWSSRVQIIHFFPVDKPSEALPSSSPSIFLFKVIGCPAFPETVQLTIQEFSKCNLSSSFLLGCSNRSKVLLIFLRTTCCHKTLRASILTGLIKQSQAPWRTPFKTSSCSSSDDMTRLHNNI